MKSILSLFLCLLGVCVSAQNFAIWFLGPNTNGIATNWPASTTPIGTNTVCAGADAIMTWPQVRALQNSLRAGMDAWQSNQTYQAAQVIANRQALVTQITQRMNAWQDFLGTPQSANSNFATIAQASQWARELLWLERKMMTLVILPRYSPENDQ